MPIGELFKTLLEAAITAQFFLFAAYLVFGNVKTRPAHIALIALCLIIGGASLINTLAFSGGLKILINLNVVLEIAISPAIFLIVTQSFEPPPPLQRRHILHITPPIVGFGIWQIGGFIPIDNFIILMHVGYLTATVYFLKRRSFGKEPGPKLHYIYSLAGYLAIFTLLKLVIVLETNLGGSAFREGWGYSIMLVLLLSLSSNMILMTLRNPNILENSQAFMKYAGSDLRPEESKMIIERLEKAFNKQRIFTESNLTLDDLAEIIKAPPRHVSQAVNDHYGTNVPTLINIKRVEDVAARLIKEPELSITTAMYDCGFGSKTSFHRAFKSRFGKTPSEYRNQG